jgi:hypothetical protein
MLIAAVKRAKRHLLYRRYRRVLSSPAPEDVWQDADSGGLVVCFRAGRDANRERLLVFAISEQTERVEANFVVLSGIDSEYTASNLGDQTNAVEPQTHTIGCEGDARPQLAEKAAC